MTGRGESPLLVLRMDAPSPGTPFCAPAFVDRRRADRRRGDRRAAPTPRDAERRTRADRRTWLDRRETVPAHLRNAAQLLTLARDAGQAETADLLHAACFRVWLALLELERPARAHREG